MMDSGLRAKITCVDPNALPREFAGRDYDASFLADLPEGVDACSENGEFTPSPMTVPCLRPRFPVSVGEVVERDSFVFADLR
jgi:diphthamide synthase (EF-2-diphthine--ammonia ligase)